LGVFRKFLLTFYSQSPVDAVTGGFAFQAKPGCCSLEHGCPLALTIGSPEGVAALFGAEITRRFGWQASLSGLQQHQAAADQAVRG
jgi:hypothetical protein